MTIYINGKCVSINLATATKQDIADFCIYDITKAINTIDFDGYEVKTDISVDLYTYGGQCFWEYDVENTDVCYSINNGAVQVLDFIGSAYDEIQSKIDALYCTDYMVAEFDAVPSSNPMELLIKVLDKLYEEVDDAITAFVNSDWYKGRGL